MDQAAARSERLVRVPFPSAWLAKLGTRRSRLLDALTVLLLPTLLLAAFDAKSSAGAEQSVHGWALWAYVLPLFLGGAALLAASFALLTALQRASARHGLAASAVSLLWPTLLAAALPVAAALALLVYALSLLSATAFNNHALAALLCALVVVVALVPLYALWLATFNALRLLRARFEQRAALGAALAWMLSAAPLVLVLAVLARRNRTGLDILGAPLWQGPALFLSALVASLLLFRRFENALRGSGRAAIALLAPLSVLLSWNAAARSAELSETALRAGFWSGQLVSLVRKLTDVDRDGVSSVFGGGDCAPFDASINPLARDVPGDGIDNNCFGGDAPPATRERVPLWLERTNAPGGLNLVVLTIDAVRFDHASFNGYERPTMPNLEALTQESQVFTRAYSGANATTAALLSMWSTLPAARVPGGQAENAPVWIPALLQQAGFQTFAGLTSWRHFSVLNHGFTRFDMSTTLNNAGGFRGHPDGQLIDGVIAFIEANKHRRFMAWSHLIGPHALYERAPGAPNFGDSQLDLYDSELWEADRQAGRLIAYLRREKLLDSTVLIVAGDHGEALGDHGVKTHRETLFEPEVRTIALMRVPGAHPRRLDQAVVHGDLLTTAMNLLGVKQGFDQLRGRNLLPVLAGYRLDDDVLLMEMADYSGKLQKLAVLRWPMKLHFDARSQTTRLFDLAHDPGETRDIGDEQQAVKAELSEHVARQLGQ